jgi:hypothetical protein
MAGPSAADGADEVRRTNPMIIRNRGQFNCVDRDVDEEAFCGITGISLQELIDASARIAIDNDGPTTAPAADTPTPVVSKKLKFSKTATTAKVICSYHIYDSY